MKEILNTPINVLCAYQINFFCDAFGSMSLTLKEIFTRYNISKINFENYVKYIFMYIGRILEAQGKDFNLNSSTIDLISGNNLLLPIIEFFISNVFDINDPNEISNIQQQIISELDKQKFESQNFFPLTQELLLNYVRYNLSPPKNFVIVDLSSPNLDETELNKEIHEQMNKPDDDKLGFIFGDRPETGSEANLFENSNVTLGEHIERDDSDVLDSIISYINSLSSEPNLFENPREIYGHDLVELTQDRNELSTLIKMLNDMRDKLSEVFSPQAIKNVINFLEDILKNNNDNEINSVCNIIHEFDEINPISVVHFFNNFFKHYPVIMNENFDFEKMVDFIDNKLFKEDIGYWKFVLKNNFYFSDLKQAVKWNFSLLQYKYFAKNFLIEIEKISNKTIEEIIEQSKFLLVYVTKILNQNDSKKLRNELITPGKDYPMERTQDDLNSEKIVKLDNELWNLKNQGKILSPKEYICISEYCGHMVNNRETEKINHVCSLISNSQNGIDKTLVESLLELASLFQHPEVMGAEPIPKLEIGEQEIEH